MLSSDGLAILKIRMSDLRKVSRMSAAPKNSASLVRRMFVAICSAACLSSLSAWPSWAALDAADGPDSLKSSMLSAWKARMQAATSFRFEWEESVTFARRFFSQIKDPSPIGNGRGHIPSSDLTLSAQCRLLVGPVGTRYTEHRKIWSTEKNKTIWQDLILVERDGETRELFPHGEFDFPVASISASGGLARILAMDGCLPLSMNYRILDPAFTVFTFSIDQMSVREAATLKESVGETVVATFQSGARTTELVLDAGRDYCPLRYSTVRPGGVPEYDLTISYVRSGQQWIPQRWTSITFDEKGHPLVSRHVTVTASELGCGIAAKELIVDFPPGSWVNDLRNGKSYVIRRDGSRHGIQSLAQYSAAVGSSSRRPPFGWIGIVASLLAVIVLLVLMGARRVWRKGVG